MSRFGFVSVLSVIPANNMNRVRADFAYGLFRIREE